MKLPKELTTVTPLSKTVALIMFTLLPIIAFLMGMKFQQKMTLYVPPSREDQVACTMDAKICPDGSSVGRSGPNCEFSPCPAADSSDEKFLGIIADIKNDCIYDGVCKVILEDGKEIIIVKGMGPVPEVAGQYEGFDFDDTKKEEFLGKETEVYARRLNDNQYTIYGDTKYYVRLTNPGYGNFCGGIAGIACPAGFKCKLDGNYPDAGGTCVELNQK